MLDFLHLLAQEDQAFVAAIDRMLKYLWRQERRGRGHRLSAGPGHPRAADQGRAAARGRCHRPVLADRRRPAPGRGRRRRSRTSPVEDEPEPTTTPGGAARALGRARRAHDEWWAEAPGWREEVRETFQRWEAQDPEFVALWKKTREWSLADFRRIFDELGAHFDVWFFESEVEEEGRRDRPRSCWSEGIAEICEGLPVVKIDEKLGLDGADLPDDADPALGRHHALFDQGSGADQAEVRGVRHRPGDLGGRCPAVALLPADLQDPGAVGLRAGEAGASPRLRDGRLAGGGDLVAQGQRAVYDDVRDAVLARAREIIDEKNPEMPPERKEQVARQVALGSLKYAMLARDNNKVVIFDLEEALSFDGHAAPYIQYAHARACRILEHAGETEETLLARLDGLDFGDVAAGGAGAAAADRVVAGRGPARGGGYRPLLIATYVYELAKRFNDFYHACPVLHFAEPTRTARLALVAATRRTLANGLALLGIAAPEEM